MEVAAEAVGIGAVGEAAEAERALTAIVDHSLPGRSTEARPPNADELRRTAVLAVAIEEASVKVRTGGTNQ